jgi:FAD/FMN-containing dehydrogenase
VAKLRSKLKSKISSILLVSFALLALILGKKTYDLAAAPKNEKDCNFVYPYTADKTTIQVSYFGLDETGLGVLQRSGTINDASCLNKTNVYAIVQVKNMDDIEAALKFARKHDLKVTPAGERHSMGGQSFSKGGLVLDMREFNQIIVDEQSKNLNVQSGASWKEVQAVLDKRGLAVKAMQSINIFSVGGTLSVNAHGVAHDPGQIAPTVRSMRVMLSSGEIKTASPTINKELFSAVLGGYGLSGIILDVDLEIVDNEAYEWKTEYMDFKDFPEYYRKEIIGNDNVGLFYARLSIAPNTYLTETAIHRYEKLDFEMEPEPLKPASKIWIKRLIFNVSKTGGIGRWIRWTAEKYLEPGVHTCISRNQATATGHEEEVCVASRNQKMNQSMEYLNVRQSDTNILHEYFIPLENSVAFIEGLREVVKNDDVNLLNVTLRIVTKDTVTALPYAKDDRIALVLYFNQKLNKTDSKKLEKATTDLIDLAIENGGTYYLPYQLYYSKKQLQAAYPEIDRFFGLKRKYDPLELFSNIFYEKYGG